MFVWLDDEPYRDPALSGWTIVRTADEAIELLQNNQVDIISLDHDLADFRQDPYPREVTGMHVVDWMIKNGVFPSIINIHSFNPSAAKRMYQKLRDIKLDNTRILQWQYDKHTALDLCVEFLED